MPTMPTTREHACDIWNHLCEESEYFFDFVKSRNVPTHLNREENDINHIVVAAFLNSWAARLEKE